MTTRRGPGPVCRQAAPRMSAHACRAPLAPMPNPADDRSPSRECPF
jgi:hypothetical protein